MKNEKRSGRLCRFFFYTRESLKGSSLPEQNQPASFPVRMGRQGDMRRSFQCIFSVSFHFPEGAFRRGCVYNSYHAKPSPFCRMPRRPLVICGPRSPRPAGNHSSQNRNDTYKRNRRRIGCAAGASRSPGQNPARRDRQSSGHGRRWEGPA